MADVKWIKLKVGMFDGMSFKKIKKAKIGGESFRDKLTAVWFELMDFAGKCNHDGAFISPREIPFTDLSDIAVMIDREEEELKLCMAFFINEGMVSVVDDIYMLSSWSAYQNTDGLEKIREQNRLRKQKQREQQKLLENVSRDSHGTVTQGHATEKEEEIEKEKEEEIEKKGEKQPSKADIDSFFESVWDLYPVKKGKGQVSDSKRKALYKIGFDEMQRAISRYLQELKRDADWRKPQNGSTFFNSGYVDYLDANFVPDTTGTNTGIPVGTDQNDLDELF